MSARFSRLVLVLLCLLLSTSHIASASPIRVPGPKSDDATPTPLAVIPPPILTPTAAATSDPIYDINRPKPQSAPYVNPNGIPTSTPTPTPGPPRLDDPVLRWLPEILAAANATGVPPEIIAAMIRVESTGDPNVISPAGARGLMQAMPDQLYAVGFGDATWHDPASNIMAGALLLVGRLASYGNWNDAIGSYFGFGCDVWGTCTDVYIGVVWSWAAYYAPIIANPLMSGFAILPTDWLPPPVVPYVRPGPPSTATPTPETPTPTSTPKTTRTPTPGDGETATATTPPETIPTGVPTGVPTAVPTQAPTQPPTEVPTAVPTEPPPPPTEPPPPPTEPPPPPSTEVPPPDPTEGAGG